MMAYMVACTTAPSTTLTTKQQQQYHDELKTTRHNAKCTSAHTNQPPYPQPGNTDLVNITSCQPHPGAQDIHCDDLNNDTPNLNLTTFYPNALFSGYATAT